MAKVYLDANDTFTLNNGATVYGKAGGNEKVLIASGTTGVIVDANVERVDLAGNVADYRFQQTGNILKVYKTDGTLLSTSTVQDDADGTQLVFANGSVAVKMAAGGTMTLGGATVSATAGSVTPVTLDATVISGTAGGGGGAQTINVAAAGSVTETSATNTTFNFATGSYTYNIAGFGTGDKLVFATAGLATISNTNFTDGVVDVQYADGGNTVTVHLTGIPAATDGTIFGSSSFNTAFGAGSLN